ncbi:hypothetical protein KIN20_027578 [Parelaphostrongylus tenuis]|uniref:Uncharacterized protein n=1 Tax=Parelaphostrongylus tenuis TaxID=148309 RepID=A0AAD5QZN8_PARTN|nr:hypothetical protein KIN20_027578 [Parelaphostrongylus tenuis]
MSGQVRCKKRCEPNSVIHTKSGHGTKLAPVAMLESSHHHGRESQEEETNGKCVEIRHNS